MFGVSPDEIAWLAHAVAYYDCALVMHPREGGFQAFLLPRTLCRGERLRLVPVRPPKKKRRS